MPVSWNRNRFTENSGLKKAFVVTGAIAFTGVLVKAGTKAYEFYKTVRDGAMRADQAFRGMVDPVRLTNDELAVANARLENQIAVLEGHHENTLKVALLESVAAGEKLAEVLDRDIERVHEVLEKQSAGILQRVLGDPGTEDIARQSDKFREHIANLTEEGNAEIRLAQERKNRDGEKEARAALNRRLDAAYLVELGEVRAAEEKAWAPRMESVGPTAAVVSVPASASSMTRGYAAYRKYLESGPNLIRRTAENEALTGRKDELGGGAEKVDPYAKKMQELAAETSSVRAELDAVGQSQAWQTMTKAVTAADVEIARMNAALGKVGLSSDQVSKMRAAFVSDADLKARAIGRKRSMRLPRSSGMKRRSRIS